MLKTCYVQKKRYARENRPLIVINDDHSSFFFQYSGQYTVVSTELRRHPIYVMVYHHWSKFLLVEFLPYVLLIVLNCLIWRRVKKMVRMRSECGFEAGSVHDEEIDLAGILVSVVSFFIVCQERKEIRKSQK